jgi:uncharacterized membrane protein YciS (DUF1049 family)
MFLAALIIAIAAIACAFVFGVLWSRTRADIRRLSDRLRRPDGEASASLDVDSFG